MIDLGCHEGAFVGAAAREGMRAYGVDRDLESLVTAMKRWHPIAKGFMSWDLAQATNFFQADVALLLSTWAYVVQEHGRVKGKMLLEDIIADVGCLFFETQLAGDGPGPSWLETDEDVRRLLLQYGEPELVITLPVGGRDATRTVWKVSSTPSV